MSIKILKFLLAILESQLNTLNSKNKFLKIKNLFILILKIKCNYSCYKKSRELEKHIDYYLLPYDLTAEWRQHYFSYPCQHICVGSSRSRNVKSKHLGLYMKLIHSYRFMTLVRATVIKPRYLDNSSNTSLIQSWKRVSSEFQRYNISHIW